MHLVKEEERKTVPKIIDMYIDIGASDKRALEVGKHWRLRCFRFGYVSLVAGS